MISISAWLSARMGNQLLLRQIWLERESKEIEKKCYCELLSLIMLNWHNIYHVEDFIITRIFFISKKWSAEYFHNLFFVRCSEAIPTRAFLTLISMTLYLTLYNHAHNLFSLHIYIYKLWSTHIPSILPTTVVI